MSDLLHDIVTACRKHGISESRFGRKAMGDPNFVHRLRQRRHHLRPATEQRARAALANIAEWSAKSRDQLVKHPLAREGAKLLAFVDPDRTAQPEFFARLEERAAELIRDTAGQQYNIGIGLLGLAAAGKREREARHAA